MTINISITQFQDAIIEALVDHFDNVTIEDYDSNKDLSELAPACLLDIEALPKGQDSCDGRYPVNVRCSLHCILGLELVDIRRQLQEFAVSVSQCVFEQGTWGLSAVVAKPTAINAFPRGDQNATEKGYDSWVVSWQQQVLLGASKWAAAEIRGGIRVAINPINDNHAAEYKPLEVAHAPDD
ncbi:hypothetical protein HQQ94_05375 [Shewanella sp. VB17]|uniref:hypothetical protein n=1 Tax=Shewanella sp. VB17 TaxID=2739432 RepID=UPI001565E1E4|nr:hypothetical protein [Shewanella sp. VB17]NRD72687.1 hypothetical protein [Shewanella sp. VB17]